MHGTNDDVYIPMNTKWLYDGAGALDKTFLFFKDWFHELHHEPKKDRKLVFKEMTKWMMNRLGPYYVHV